MGDDEHGWDVDPFAEFQDSEQDPKDKPVNFKDYM